MSQLYDDFKNSLLGDPTTTTNEIFSNTTKSLSLMRVFSQAVMIFYILLNNKLLNMKLAVKMGKFLDQ